MNRQYFHHFAFPRDLPDPDFFLSTDGDLGVFGLAAVPGVFGFKVYLGGAPINKHNSVESNTDIVV